MCIFCKIIEGELPSYKVYEDERVLAFLDINPLSDGHVLVVPKIHEQFVERLPIEYHEALFSSIRKLVCPIQEAMESPASNVIVNNGPNAGQIIPHVHVHIIPRPKPVGNQFFTTISRLRQRDEEYFNGIAEKIREKIT